jgi:hypothetical protein
MADLTADYGLPGVHTVINDGGLAITPPPAGTKLTILGTTTNTTLPLREPVRITDVKLVAVAIDHPDGTPSEMSLAVYEALRAGAQTIEVVKISENSGEDTGTYFHETRFDDLESAYDVLKLSTVDVVHPAGAYLDVLPTGVNSAGTTRKNLGKQLADFCYQATKEANTAIGVIGTRLPLQVAVEEAWSGITATDRADWLFDTPSLAEVSEWVEHLSANTGSSTFGSLDHSADNTHEDYLAGSDETSAGEVSATYDFWAREEDGTTATDQRGNNVDGGARISVLAMPARVRHQDVLRLANKLGKSGQTSMNTNGAAAYAGLVTRLVAENGTTNQTIAGVFSARQLNATLATQLLNFRFVSGMDRTRGFVVTDGITGAYNASAYTRSDFVRLTTVRIVDAAVDIVRSAGEQFIGLPINNQHLAALNTAIRTALDLMKASGALQRFEFSLISSPDQQVLGELDVDMTLVPAFELRDINHVVSLTKPT